MNRFIVLLFCMSILIIPVSGQASFTLSGQITGENNRPLADASVILSPGGEGAVSDAEGRYFIKGLKKGSYIIQISFMGYETLVDTIYFNSQRVYNATLLPALQSLQEVVVTDNYAEKRKKEESLSIEIVNDGYLRQNQGGSLMESLERLPGVTTIGIGSGQSKPVIRGLGFNRVVVIENGIKHEGQQWGADHGLEIDQYASDNFEVIKGPASLMYGSDAIGGVIDVEKRKIPASNTLGGKVDFSGKSNNNLLGASVSLFGREGAFFAGLQATILDFGDYKVPTDSVDIYSYRAALHNNFLRNTAGKEQNFHFSTGFIRPGFQSRILASSVNSKNGFFANAHGLEPRRVDAGLHDKTGRDVQYPFQKVNHFKIINKSSWRRNAYKIETALGFQRNFRQERSQYVNHGYMPAIFPDSLGFPSDLERQFEKYIYSGNLKVTYSANKKTLFTAGVSSDFQDNSIDGRGFIIPAFKRFMLGGFAFARYSINPKSTLQAGLRYDRGNLNIWEYLDWFPSPVGGNGSETSRFLKRAVELNRTFTAFSWSAGYNFTPDHWSVKANIGKSFRMPNAKELAANGVNYHRFSYEVGKPDLSPETSYQADAGAEFHTKNFAVGASPFVNYFSNYIYLNPTAEHDRLYGNGHQVFYYTQSEVWRFGGEIHAHYQLFKSLQLGVIGEYVYSKQLSGEKEGFTLPFSPPASLLLNAKYQQQKFSFLNNFYFSVDYRITAPQNNIVPPEEPTAGSQVINVGIGGDVVLKNERVELSLQVRNLLNRKYFNHTSYYRLINVPEPGRNIILNVSIPFSGDI